MADSSNTNTTAFGNQLTNANGAIPIIFSKKLALALGLKGQGAIDNLTNENWAGEIKEQGDRVRIVLPQVPEDSAIAFGSLSDSNNTTAGQVCPVFQQVAPTSLDLVIDRVATFGLTIDDVQKAQTQFKNWLDGQANAYGQKLQTLKDREIIQAVFNDTTSTYAGNYGNLGAAYTTKITPQNIFAMFLQIKEDLINTGAIGEDGVYSFKPMEEEARDERAVALVTPRMHSLLLASYQVGGRSVDMADVVVKDGAINRVAGIDIVIDKNLTKLKQSDGETAATGLPFLVGTKNAITRAEQISKVESTRDPYCFRDLVKGLNLYGYKVVHPECIVRGSIEAVEFPDFNASVPVTIVENQSSSQV